ADNDRCAVGNLLDAVDYHVAPRIIDQGTRDRIHIRRLLQVQLCTANPRGTVAIRRIAGEGHLTRYGQVSGAAHATVENQPRVRKIALHFRVAGEGDRPGESASPEQRSAEFADPGTVQREGFVHDESGADKVRGESGPGLHDR